MQPDPFKKTFVASAVISELQSSDIYLTVKARLFDLDANLNGVRVTSSFMSEIVENEEKYIGIPLCADVRGLIDNRTIGHMYDPRTGEFHSTAIGSFYHFEMETDESGTYLVGYARIMKRNKAVCSAIAQLFAANELKFSFEISCGSYSEDENGVIVIDRDERNFLEGAAVVTFPACEGAVAQALVAELSESKGDENMDNEVKTVTAEEEVKTETAEEAKTEEVAEVKAEETAETEAKAEETVAECKEEEKAEEASTEVAEDKEPEPEEEEKPEEEECACDDKKKTAEAEPEAEQKEDAPVSVAEQKIVELIASLKAEVEALQHEIAEYKETLKKEPEEKQVNPFMAEMTAPKKYSLLDPAEKHEATSYTLI